MPHPQNHHSMLFIRNNSPEPFSSVRRKLTSETRSPETKVICQQFTSGILSKRIKPFCSPKPQKANYSIKPKQIINQTGERQFWLEMKSSSRIPAELQDSARIYTNTLILLTPNIELDFRYSSETQPAIICGMSNDQVNVSSQIRAGM